MKKSILTINNYSVLHNVWTPVTIKSPDQVQAPVRKRLWNMPCSLHLRNNNLFIYQQKETTQISQHKYIHLSFLLDYPNLSGNYCDKAAGRFVYLPHCSGTSSLQFCESLYLKSLGLTKSSSYLFLKYPHPAVLPTQTLLQRKPFQDAYTNTVKTWKSGDILALCRYKQPSTH